MKTLLNEFKRIKNLSGNTTNKKMKKGRLFEALLARYFDQQKEKHDVKEVLFGPKLSESQMLSNDQIFGYSNIDLVIKHTDESYSVIVAKCYTERNFVTAEIIHQASVVRQYIQSKGLKLRDLSIYTSGHFSSDAEDYADKNSVKLINGFELENLLKAA